jgi:glycosyltransferase involved in cell wall biosynthesis
VRVLLDYRPALRARTGVGEYLHQTVRALAETAAPGDEVVAFSSSWKDRMTSPGPGIGTVDRQIPVSLLNLLWHRAGWPPVQWLAGPVDVAHSPTPLLVPAAPPATRVVTIHDLFFLDVPDATSGEIRRDYGRLVAGHARQADLVLTSSRHVGALVVERLGVDPGRLVTCPAGAPSWAPRPRVPEDGPVVFLGTLEPRKNVVTLLNAWEILAQRGVRVPTLLLAGGAPASAAPLLARLERPPLAGRVQYLGYLPDHDREAFYKTARLLVLPSLDEGFGMPLVEAFAAGTPVLASRNGSLPETGGDAPVYLDPLDTEAWAHTITALLDTPSALEAMRVRGLARVRAFSWLATARTLWAAYQAAGAGAGR